VTTTEGTSAEGLARLFRDNVWKLYGLPESMMLDMGPQFAAELMKELNRMLEIETKLSTVFHPQTDESRVGTVLEVLYRLQAEGLARMVSVGRVCSEQQGSHCNQGFVFYGKLWKRVKCYGTLWT